MDILYTYPRRLQYRFKRKRTVAPVSWPCQNKRSSLSNVMTYSYTTNATNEPVGGLVLVRYSQSVLVMATVQ